MNDIVVGIDLGTTFSAVAHVNELGSVEVIPNREGQATTPSVVLVRDGQFVVGQEAASQALLYPDDVARCIKRYMGDPDFKFQGFYSPEQISAEILKKLIVDAADELGRPIRRAVITVPAYFTGWSLEKTKEAGERAGLQVEDLLHEPEAAAIYFGVHRLTDGERVLVCDLGGGTYDATILLMKDGVLYAERTRGSSVLGGHDWTSALVDLYAQKIRDQLGEDPRDDPAQLQRLYDQAEANKCALSSTPMAKLSWSSPRGTAPFQVTRDEFEAATESLLAEVLDKTSEVILDANLKPADIQHVIAVGGSSRLPSFLRGIERVVGRPPQRVKNPDEAVACGAALVAAGFAAGDADRSRGRITVSSRNGGRLVRIAVQRRTSHALGTLTYSGSGASLKIEPTRMIEENADLPAVAERRFRIAALQRTLQVPVLQLDSQNEVQLELGNYRFDDLPASPQDTEVRVVFRYDASGLPHVSVIDSQTGRELVGRREKFVMPEPTAVVDRGEATVVLAVDCSFSMYGSKLQEAKQIFVELAKKYSELGRNWSISVVNFGGPSGIYPASVLLPPTRDLSNIEEVAAKLNVGGGTPMVAALDHVRRILEGAKGKRLAIIITDGMPDSVTGCRQTAQTLQAVGIQIATVPVGSDADRDFLRSIGQLESDVQVSDSGHGMAAAVLDLLKNF